MTEQVAENVLGSVLEPELGRVAGQLFLGFRPILRPLISPIGRYSMATASASAC